MDPEQIKQIRAGLQAIKDAGLPVSEAVDYLGSHGLTPEEWRSVSLAQTADSTPSAEGSTWRDRMMGRGVPDPRKPGYSVAGELREIAQGITPAADEIEAALRPGVSQADIAARRREYEDDVGFGSTIGSNLLGALLPMGVAAKLSMAGKIPGGLPGLMAVGGATGAASGALAADENRGLGALVGGGVGAAAGPVGALLGLGVAKGYGVARNVYDKGHQFVTKKTTQRAQRLLDADLGEQVLTEFGLPGRLGARRWQPELQNPQMPLPRPSGEQTVAEYLGDRGVDLHMAALSQMGDAAQAGGLAAGKEAVERTVQRANREVRDALTTLTGLQWGTSGDRLAREAGEELRTRFQREYDDAYEVIRRGAQRDGGMANAPRFRELRRDPDIQSAMEYVHSVETEVHGKELGPWSVEVYERAARHLRQLARRAPDARQGAAYMRAARRVDDALNEYGDINAVRTAYSRARLAEQASSGKISPEPGTRRMRKWSETTVSVDDLRDWWDDAPEEVRRALRLRMAADVQDMAEQRITTSTDGLPTNAVRLLDDRLNGKLAIVFGQEGVEELSSKLDDTARGIVFSRETRRGLASASRTLPALAEQKATEGAAAGTGYVAQGMGGAGFRTGIQNLLYNPATKAATAAHTARRMGSRNVPGTLRGLLDAVQFRDYAELYRRGLLSGTSAVTGLQAGGVAGQRY